MNVYQKIIMDILAIENLEIKDICLVSSAVEAVSHSKSADKISALEHLCSNVIMKGIDDTQVHTALIEIIQLINLGNYDIDSLTIQDPKLSNNGTYGTDYTDENLEIHGYDEKLGEMSLRYYNISNDSVLDLQVEFEDLVKCIYILGMEGEFL